MAKAKGTLRCSLKILHSVLSILYGDLHAVVITQAFLLVELRVIISATD